MSRIGKFVLVVNILGVWAEEKLTFLVPGFRHASIEREIPFTTLIQCQLECLKADGCIGISVNTSHCSLSHDELGFLKDESSTALGEKGHLPNCTDRAPSGFTSVTEELYLHYEPEVEKTYADAVAHCRGLGKGSHIFEPRTLAILNIFRDRESTHGIWISLRNPFHNICFNASCDAKLEWGNGSKFHHQPWMTSENLAFTVSGGEECLRLNKRGIGISDSICEAERPFLCQFVCVK